MSTEGRMNDFHRQREKILKGGGDERIAKQHREGKMTARERIAYFLDEGSFVETDAFMKHRSTDLGMEAVEAPGEGVVTGYGTVDGRLVFVYSQDFTVLGGSLGEMHALKICKCADLALKMGAPLICLNDSGGARIQEGVDALSGFGAIFYRNTLASGVIPQISAIMGPCAGGAAYSPALTDFVFMVDGTSRMFITGPQVIQAVTGEEVSGEDLGGGKAHNAVSGVAHFLAADDRECLDSIRKLLSYLPSNNMEEPPKIESTDPANRVVEEFISLLPESSNKSYDMYEVIKKTLDLGSFFEVQAHFAKNVIVGFGRLDGKTVGVVANQPKVLAGCLDINASDKAARFVRFCDCFNIPIVNFVDVPGFLPGVQQEHGGIIRHGAKMLYAFSEATVPKIIVVIRKLYGGAYLAMCSKSMGADQVIAWPTAEIAVMGPEGAANIIFKREIAQAQDPQQTREEKIEEYRERFANPYQAAAHGYVDSVIDPRETRSQVISALNMLRTKREDRPSKKHGNFPV